MLAPGVGLLLEHDVLERLPPVADRCEGVAYAARLALPEVEDDRLAGWTQAVAVRDRQAAVRSAVVLGKGEVGAVLIEEVDRPAVVLVKLDLKLHGIGLEI